MIRHLLTLIWNRKRSNKWLVLEIGLSFLAVFAIVTTFLHFRHLYNIPLGYEYENIWEVTFDMGANWDNQNVEILAQIRDDLKGFGPIEEASIMQMMPFRYSSWTSTTYHEEKEINAQHGFVDDGVKDLIGIQMLEGRWFGPQDDGSKEIPVVIDRMLKEQLFGDTPALGQTISSPESDTIRRVVGVMEIFRQFGELNVPRPYVMLRANPEQEYVLRVRNLALKMDGSQTPEFEAELAKKLDSLAPSWNASIDNWKSRRTQHMKPTLVPLIILAIIVAFVMLMVALGLLGVLWQNVLQRVQEIGLRQAMGASKSSIVKQISLEMFLKTSLALLIGAILAVQVPLIAQLPVQPLVWVGAFGLSFAIIFALTLSCSLYPAFLASKIEPAIALKDE